MAKLGIRKKASVHVTLDPTLDKLLIKTAYETGKNKSQIVEEALMAYFAKLNEEEKEKEKE